MTLRLAVLSLPVVLASACAPIEPVRVDAAFGTSVEQTIEAQTLNPWAAANPDPEPVMGIDGPKAEAVLEAYRQDVSRPPAEIPSVINIAVGAQ